LENSGFEQQTSSTVLSWLKTSSIEGFARKKLLYSDAWIDFLDFIFIKFAYWTVLVVNGC
jgi:hypothetical protein